MRTTAKLTAPKVWYWGVAILNGQPEAALESYTSAVHKLENVLQTVSWSGGVKHHAAMAHGGRADALVKLGCYAEWIADWDRLLELSKGNDGDWHRTLRAHALALAGDHVRVTAEATALADKEGASGEVLQNVATIHSVSAEAARQDTKRSSAERESLAEAYSARAVALLRRAQTTGYFKEMAKIEDLKKDPHVDSLRSRPDFRQLLADLERDASIKDE